MSRRLTQAVAGNGALRAVAIPAYRSYARHMRRGSGPRVLANGIPKGGTHLLTALLDGLPGLPFSGYQDTLTTFRRTPFTTAAYAADDVDWAALRGHLGRIGAGQYSVAHFPFAPSLQALLDELGFRHVVIIRDPRDIAVSDAAYIRRTRRHLHHERVAAMSEADGLAFVIGGCRAGDGTVALGSIGARMANYARWIEQDGAYVCRFETSWARPAAATPAARPTRSGRSRRTSAARSCPSGPPRSRRGCGTRRATPSVAGASAAGARPSTTRTARSSTPLQATGCCGSATSGAMTGEHAAGRGARAALRRNRALRTAAALYRHRACGPDDVIVASYPKSGNTWLKFLLADVLTDSDPDFARSERAIPLLGSPAGSAVLPGGGHLWKSHEPYSPLYRRRCRRAVYLVRDARDVAISEYHFLTRKGRFDGDLDGFLDVFLAGSADGYGSWDAHVASWCDGWRGVQRDRISVRYEDMLADCEAALAGCCASSAPTCPAGGSRVRSSATPSPGCAPRRSPAPPAAGRRRGRTRRCAPAPQGSGARSSAMTSARGSGRPCRSRRMGYEE